MSFCLNSVPFDFNTVLYNHYVQRLAEATSIEERNFIADQLLHHHHQLLPHSN